MRRPQRKPCLGACVFFSITTNHTRNLLTRPSRNQINDGIDTIHISQVREKITGRVSCLLRRMPSACSKDASNCSTKISLKTLLETIFQVLLG